MKKNEDLKVDIHDALKGESLLEKAGTGISMKFTRNLRMVIILTSLAGIGLLFNGCVGGYITTEPSYAVISVRPAQPSNLHIWIDGDWAWNNQTHVYVQKSGYWAKPRQGQTHISGHWQASPKGKYWVAGRWQKQSRQVDHGTR